MGCVVVDLVQIMGSERSSRSSDNWKKPHVIEVIWSSQHRFMKVKVCLTSLIAFYDYMNGFVDE